MNKYGKHYTLTTVDNPYSPFDEFEEWYKYDCLHQYGTTEVLSRLCITSPQFTDEENAEAIEEAVDIVLDNNFLGIYKRAFEGDDFRAMAVPNPLYSVEPA